MFVAADIMILLSGSARNDAGCDNMGQMIQAFADL
jgi:hypothetical protein